MFDYRYPVCRIKWSSYLDSLNIFDTLTRELADTYLLKPVLNQTACLLSYGQHNEQLLELLFGQ